MKIKVFLPYFGVEFPKTFDVLLFTMKRNTKIDFIVPTNINFSQYESYAENITFVNMNLSDVKYRIESILKYTVKLKEAYKICDFKPSFGEIFSDYLEDAEWWGYIDPDVILGDINSFIDSVDFDMYERVLSWGHLTFYKNTDYVNKLWRKEWGLEGIVPSIKEVSTRNTPFYFDEKGQGKGYGYGIIYAQRKLNALKAYENVEFIADVSPGKFNFWVRGEEQVKYFKVLKNNKLYGYFEDGSKKEYLYVHLQKRSMENKLSGSIPDEFYIYPNVIDRELFTVSKDEQKELWEKDKKRRDLKRKLGNIKVAYFLKKFKYRKLI
ncbi:hypothetical protein FC40_GL000361 [Ligilactobacillus hayakitensis DSM 18933 = JCM 14209]|uniref:Uncharacterized protein n=1 Tax=Ligilactobacillus hayakitensis DSM 18933 = JCM 14209 TaxID=1423755 RepID=A0A0R1WX90_9LACO|nr:DUF6625 family protein [Ligilactobacillus hayakitensis]KRM20121.1 hypothetical protein FC40_GL000361 [Ligilactobacillus hayakitensis DSM 18933 = JCM 14209]